MDFVVCSSSLSSAGTARSSKNVGGIIYIVGINLVLDMLVADSSSRKFPEDISRANLCE